MSAAERYASLTEELDDGETGTLMLLAGILTAGVVTIGYLALTLLVFIPIVGMRRLALLRALATARIRFVPGRARRVRVARHEATTTVLC